MEAISTKEDLTMWCYVKRTNRMTPGRINKEMKQEWWWCSTYTFMLLAAVPVMLSPDLVLAKEYHKIIVCWISRGNVKGAVIIVCCYHYLCSQMSSSLAVLEDQVRWNQGQSEVPSNSEYSVIPFLNSYGVVQTGCSVAKWCSVFY